MATLCLVCPPQVYSAGQISSGLVPPIGPCYIAAYARQCGHRVTIVDGLGEGHQRLERYGTLWKRGLTVEEIVARIPGDADLIGISNLFGHAVPLVREIARGIKRRAAEIPIIVGGVTPTAIPGIVLSCPEIDYVCVGEGERVVANALARIDAGRPVSDLKGLAYRRDGGVVINPREERIADLDSLPFPAYDLIPIENYITARCPHGAARGRWLPLQGSRGCAYKCTFCTAPHTWAGQRYGRSPENIAEEMLYWNRTLGITDFHCEDVSLIETKEWAVRFAAAVEEKRLRVTWQVPNGIRSEAIDPESVALLKKSGCRNITFAAESGSPRVLGEMRKELNLGDLVEAARASVRAGLITCVFFVIGTPAERPEDFEDTRRLIRRLARMGVHEISVTTFSALPGSELFFNLVKEGKVTFDDEFFFDLLKMADLTSARSWNPHLDNQELGRIRRQAYLSFFVWSALFRPWRPVAWLFNGLCGRQTCKIERIIHEKFLTTMRILRQTRAGGAEPGRRSLGAG